MKEQVLGNWASRLLLLIVCLGASRIAAGQRVTAVPELDLNHYMGVWYEVARLPTKIEKSCVSDATVLYALGTKASSFQVGIFCKAKDGSSDEWDANGKMHKTGDGRLKIAHLWPFYKKYWVLATGPEYEWALVGSPNRKSLWVLSRTANVDSAMLTAIEARASAQGFETAKLISQPQHH